MNRTTRKECAAYKEAMLCQFLVPWLGWQSIQKPDDLQIKTKLWSFKVSDDKCNNLQGAHCNRVEIKCIVQVKQIISYVSK